MLGRYAGSADTQGDEQARCPLNIAAAETIEESADEFQFTEAAFSVYKSQFKETDTRDKLDINITVGCFLNVIE